MLPNLAIRPNVAPFTIGMNAALATQKPASNAFYDLIVDGDLGKLNAEQRVQYLKAVSESLGLNPMTRPFGLITLDKKVTLYALKEASTQLAKRDNVSVTLGEYQYVKERNMLMVMVTASSPDGRKTDDIAAIPLGDKVAGEAAANAYMKLATKAKRRAILTHCGLGIIDESELETIPNVREIKDEPATKTIEIGRQEFEAKRPDDKVEPARRASNNDGLGSEATIFTPPSDREPSSSAFDYNSNDDRQWLINIVKDTFPKITRPDALAICSTFAKATEKKNITDILMKRLEIEMANKAAGKPSLVKD